MTSHESYNRIRKIIEQNDHEVEEIKKQGAEVEFLKKKRFSQVISFRFPGVEHRLILKIVYPYGRRASRFFRRFKKSSCLVEHQKTLHFHKQGVGVVLPIFAGEKRRFGVLKKSYSLAPVINGTILLGDYFAKLDNSKIKEKRAAIRLLGQEVGRMHSKFLYHCDLTCSNILIKKNAHSHQIFLIDCGLGRIHNKIKPKLIYRDLRRLRNSTKKRSIITNTDLLRFAKVYCRHNPQMSTIKLARLLYPNQ
jgi:tRNA A-37 threonylcarbamoyl transferase component Bud32